MSTRHQIATHNGINGQDGKGRIIFASLAEEASHDPACRKLPVAIAAQPSGGDGECPVVPRWECTSCSLLMVARPRQQVNKYCIGALRRSLAGLMIIGQAVLPYRSNAPACPSLGACR